MSNDDDALAAMTAWKDRLAVALTRSEARVTELLVWKMEAQAVIRNDAILFAKIEQRMRDCWEGTGMLGEDGTASNDFRVWMNEAHNRARDLKAALGKNN